jgi:PII-like signaling protein
MPAVVEIVTTEAQIRSFLEAIEPIMGSSLITLEKVRSLRYGDRPS